MMTDEPRRMARPSILDAMSDENGAFLVGSVCSTSAELQEMLDKLMTDRLPPRDEIITFFLDRLPNLVAAYDILVAYLEMSANEVHPD
jgi:hypothetical protein